RIGDHDNTAGIGLGLSVARGFVEAMGGSLQPTETPGGAARSTTMVSPPPGVSVG
ncbi:hypothetical protein, partial [Mycolicibacter sinensis]|uniref:hypothetical protein n=1 Tax=Mycolicibacter sinensis (strain JDM601) TaxID=875328 RepID=UPI003D161DE5